MKQQLYGVYDSCIEGFTMFFVNRTDKEAERNFKLGAREGMLKEHPEHYSLHRMCSFDDGDGIVESEGHTVMVCQLKELELDLDGYPDNAGLAAVGGSE